MAKKAGKIIDGIMRPKVDRRKYPMDFMPVKLYKQYFHEACKERLGKEKVKMNDTIRTVLNYFYGTMDFDRSNTVLNWPDLDKGLFIFGDFGVGKTVLMDIVHIMGKKMILNHGSTCMHMMAHTAPWFCEQYMAKANDKSNLMNFSLEHYYKGKLYIDDVGMEKAAFKDFEVVADILFHRHRNGVPTYLTTNLTPKEFGERYGARIADRLPEYFNIIKFGGKSLREA